MKTKQIKVLSTHSIPDNAQVQEEVAGIKRLIKWCNDPNNLYAPPDWVWKLVHDAERRGVRHAPSRPEDMQTLADVLPYGLTCAIIDHLQTQKKHLTEDAKQSIKRTLHILKGDFATTFPQDDFYPEFDRQI